MDSSSEVLVHAGDYNLEELTILTNSGELVDFSNFMLELNLFEDLFSPCLNGNIVLADATNLISNLPITGNEYITMKMRTPTLEDVGYNVIEKSFQIYSISDRLLNDDRSQYYIISFISIEGNLDPSIPVSRSFNGTTDEVATKVYEEHIQCNRRVDVEGSATPLFIYDAPHTSRIKYTSNYWSPFKNMNFISKRVKGTKLFGADYLFFESNKSFHFASLESLIDAQKNTGIFEEYVIERDGSKMPRRISEIPCIGHQFDTSMTKVENFKMIKTVDILEGNDNGSFASCIYGYDFLTKKIVSKTVDFAKDMKSFIKTGDGSILPPNITRDPLASKQFFSYNSGMYNDFATTDEEDLPNGATVNKMADRILYRKSYLSSFDNYKFEMTIPGRTDIEVGQLINLLHPAPEKPTNDKDIDSILDPLLSGLYIISAIHHRFDKTRHVMDVEIIKNGLSSSFGEDEGGENVS